MNIRDLKYFIAVAQLKHFGLAAEHCFVTQPTLSMQLKKLERQLGLTLFERNNKQVLITAAGEKILAHALSIISEVEKINQISKQAQDPLSGPFQLGVIPTLAPYLLPWLMPRFIKALPNLELFLIEEKTEVLTRMLADGRIDAAIMARPIEHAQLSFQPLFEEEFYFICAQSHKLANKSSIAIEDIDSNELLLLSEGHCLREQAIDICHLPATQNHLKFSATSLETLRHMVSAKRGITLLPALSIHQDLSASPPYAIQPISAGNNTRQIALYFRKNTPASQVNEKISHEIKSIIPEILNSIKNKIKA